MVALRRLACEGSTGAAVLSVSQMFGIGEGTVTLYTKRVVKALSQLQAKVVTWPTNEEKLQMRTRLQGKFPLFEDCIGILDGTLIAFKNRPNRDPTVYTQYYNHRKAKYGLYATVICDDQKRFIHFCARWGGAVHDARALRTCEIGE